MMHYLLAYLDYISTRPIFIAATCIAIIGLVVYGRVKAARDRQVEPREAPASRARTLR